MKLINLNCREFETYIKNKTLICYGLSKAIDYSLPGDVLRQIAYFADSNIELHNTSYRFMDLPIEVPVVSPHKLIDLIKKDGNTFLLVTSKINFKEVVMQLNKIKELGDLEYAVLALLSLNDCRGVEIPMEIKAATYSEQMIPKIIHYCWLGNNELPDRDKKCIDSWRKHCPDWEIKLWNEDNYDFCGNNYAKKAYKVKKWGFVPDYARLDILYNYGGVYFDTDVMVLKDLEPLLHHKMFLAGFGYSQLTGMMGAMKNHPLIKKFRDYYDTIEFDENNLIACSYYQNKVLKQSGWQQQSGFSIIEDCVIYPNEYFPNMIKEYITDNSFVFHIGNLSWFDPERRYKDGIC